MRTLLIIAFILPALTFTGCDKPPAASSAAMTSAPESHKYEIRIDGVPGVQLDMLLVWNPTQGGPERVVERITTPYSKTFEGTGGYAWFDSLPNGASGKADDTYTIDWLVDGEVRATVHGKIKPKNKQSASLGRW